MCEGDLNLALDSIVNVGWMDVSPERKDFLWYLRQFGVKRLRRENDVQYPRSPGPYFDIHAIVIQHLV